MSTESYIPVERFLGLRHEHVFLGVGHEANERKTRAVIALCALMMALEIVGGTIFGSLALVADGLHMATHVLAILIAVLAYGFARRHAADRRFTFGTGKVGDLAGFSSAIILAVIALVVGYEAVIRFFSPIVIHFSEAIPIAILGLGVNILSAWLLSGPHEHGGSYHSHAAAAGAEDGSSDGEQRRFLSPYGEALLEISEVAGPPRFRLRFARTALRSNPPAVVVETERPGGVRRSYELRPAHDRDFLESLETIPEPHEFLARVRIGMGAASFEESLEFSDTHRHDHPGHSHATHRDHNFRSAFVHVVGDAFVSLLAIVGLLAARYLGWIWMDPFMGLVGAGVIAAWSYALVRDTTRVLVDMTPDAALEARIRERIERDGDRVCDLHLWRLGPGHLGAIITVATLRARDAAFYKARLRRFNDLSHVTVEVHSGG